jgi:hypothetical protein
MLVTLGILFLPLAIWFAYANWHRYWGNALALAIVGLVFLRVGLNRDEDSWLSSIDDLGDDSRS